MKESYVTKFLKLKTNSRVESFLIFFYCHPIANLYEARVVPLPLDNTNKGSVFYP